MKRKLFRVLARFVAPSQNEKRIFSILLVAGLIFFSSAQKAWALDPQTPQWVDTLLDILAGVITKLAMGVGQVAVFLIGMVTIPLLQYNEFVTSPVVGMGWAIVRDAVNMFYVIVLILIAFGTVLGIDKYKWREQIPRLLGTAIIVNFSRTLCGIMIDFSQVMTLTFVNAIKDIAGGNFVQLFGITSILDANSASKLFDATGSTPPSSFDVFIASIVALMMMMIVLITILFLTIIFAYRIVLLWALVTIAPLAWFFKGAKGAVNPKKDPYGTWWTRFSCALQVGPILTFFLWLALAVAGSGDIARTAGFTTSNAPEGEGLDVGSILKAMSMDQMVGFVVGIALIFVGFDAASDACAGTDGQISGLLKKGKDLMQPVAMAPVAGAALAAKYGWKGVRATGKGAYNQTIGRGMAKTRNLAGSVMGKMGEKGWVPTPVRSFLANQGQKIKAKETAEAEATIKDKPMSKDALVAFLKGGPSAFDVNNRQYSARLKEALGRDDVMADLTANPEVLKKILGQRMGTLGQTDAASRFRDTFAGDPAALKQLDTLKKKLPTVFGGVGDINDAEDIKAMSDAQLASPEVQSRILNDLTKDKKSGFVFEDKEGNRQEMDMAEAIEKGKLGEKVRKAWLEGRRKTTLQRSVGNLVEKPIESISADNISKAEGRMDEKEGVSVAAQILSGNDEEKIKALWGRGEFKDLIAGLTGGDAVKKVIAEEHLRSLMAAGLSKNSDVGQRARFRSNLASRGVDLLQSFDLTQSSSDAGQLTFQDAASKSDFEAAVSNNPVLLAQAIKKVADQGKRSEEVDSLITPENVKKLLARFKAAQSGSQEKEEARTGLEQIFGKMFGSQTDDAAKVSIESEAQTMVMGDGTPVVTNSGELERKKGILRMRRRFNAELKKLEDEAKEAAETSKAAPATPKDSEELEKRIKDLQELLDSRMNSELNDRGEKLATRGDAEARIRELAKKLKAARKKEQEEENERIWNATRGLM